MLITVGRTALNHRLKQLGVYISPRNTDIDVWTLEGDKLPSSKGVLHVDSTVMPQEVMNSFQEQSKFEAIATLEDLLAIKLSHLSYDIFWHKHKQDILLLKRLTEGKYNRELGSAFREHWKGEFGNKDFLSLYRTKDKFFDDFVPKLYEHDYLHELMAFPDPPVYTSCLKEGHDVFVDKEKWNDISNVRKIRMMKEEIAVIALERWLIPALSKQKNVFTIQQVWNKSLHKTVTHLTKGIFCDFIVENIEEFLFPLEKEMLYVLSRLNLKEIYMSNNITMSDFITLLSEALLAEGKVPRWDDEWVDVDILMGDFPENNRVEFIEQGGGGEGGAENCYSVIKVDGIFYKVFYNYYSHDGFNTECAKVRVVQPKEKLVTVYE